MNNSPYLDRPLLSERERRLVDALRAAVEYIETRCEATYQNGTIVGKARDLLRELDPS